MQAEEEDFFFNNNPGSGTCDCNCKNPGKKLSFNEWHKQHLVADNYGYENVPSLRLMEFIWNHAQSHK